MIAIDWKAADVRDGRLRVPLSESASKQWVAAFDRVVARLERHSSWGDVSASKQRLEVTDVAEGEEPSLRHFLESALLQANTVAGEDDSDEEDDDEDRSDTDQRMTERFRAFAGG